MDAAILAQMSTQELQTLLKEDYNDGRSLSVEQVLCVCRILAQRNPFTETEVRADWERFLTHYAQK